MLPAMNSYLTAMHEDDSKPHASTSTIGSMYGFFSLGFVITPWIGGEIAASLGIHWVFVPSFLCFLASAFAIWNIAHQPSTRQSGSSVPARVAARALLANRRYLLVAALTFAIVLAVGLTLPFAAPYAQHVAHLSDAWIGLLGSCASLGDFTLGLSLGFLAARLGSRRSLLVLVALCGASFVWLLLAKSGLAMLPAFMLRGGFAAGLSLLTVKIGQTLPPHLLGAGFGIFETVIQVALIVSSYAGGVLYGMQFRLPFQLAIAGIVLCLIAMPFGRVLWVRAPGGVGARGISGLSDLAQAAYPVHPSSVPSVHALHE
jgi:predicted MFS family arabinose efflux permease